MFQETLKSTGFYENWKGVQSSPRWSTLVQTNMFIIACSFPYNVSYIQSKSLYEAT